MSRPFVVIVTFALLAAAAIPVARPAAAHQQGHVHGRKASGARASADADSARMTAASEQVMSGHHDHHAMAHLRMTPARAATAADSARAAQLVATLREATAKYADVHRAEADGYRQFAPQVKQQRVFHYTQRSAAIAAAFRFDPSRPTSLLYTRAPDGTMTLVGAMYTAPRRASMEELDRRVPLSMAQWHRHVDLCIPKRGDTARWAEKDSSGAMKFGPAGSIASEAACAAAGGRWLDSLFGWMVHVNAWSDDPRAVFEDR